MKSRYIIAVSCVALAVVILGALSVYLLMTPLVALEGGKPAGDIFDPETQVGRIVKGLSECAQKQKGLFSYIEAYRQKHGRVPDSMNVLINDDVGSMSFTDCPLGHGYVIHAENYGKADAVLISESRNEHPTALKLWIRGIKPRVQTMGDGTIYMFEGGKVLTMQAKRN
ncbi:MAG: hypothetical protein ACYSWO_13035 [Planctomycetota bacterium]